MGKILNNQIMRNLLSTLLFGSIYAFLSVLDDGTVEVGVILRTMVCYFLILCLLYFLAPKLRKITGHERDIGAQAKNGKN